MDRGQALVERMHGTRTEIGGFMDVLTRAGVEVLPLFGGDATTSGRLHAADYQVLREIVLDSIGAALPADGILLGLHGAMCAEGVDDVEGNLSASWRASACLSSSPWTCMQT